MSPKGLLTPFVIASCLALAVCVAGCGDDDHAETTPSSDGDSAAASDIPELEGELTVFAAASLTDAFNEIGDVLESENEELDIEFNFASSSALRTQIEEGAPADVFASAAVSQMALAIEAGLVDGEGEVFVRNLPVIVVPADNPAGIETPAGLANDGVKLVLAGEDVPIGQYAREVIANLARDPNLGDGFDDAVLDNVVSNEADVRAVLAKVELGEADAGIVYITDAMISAEVEVIDIPEEFNVISDYPIAIVSDAGDIDAARAFINFVLSDAGQAILTEYGFEPA